MNKKKGEKKVKKRKWKLNIENFPPSRNKKWKKHERKQKKKVSNLSCVKKGNSRCCVALNFPTQWIPIRHLGKILQLAEWDERRGIIRAQLI